MRQPSLIILATSLIINIKILSFQRTRKARPSARAAVDTPTIGISRFLPCPPTNPSGLALGPAPVLLGIFMVVDPTTKFPPRLKLTLVPSIVAEWLPAEKVVPSTTIVDESPVNVMPPAVKITALDVAAVGKISTLEVPMTRVPEGASDMDVPDIMTAWPPGDKVVSATCKPVGFAVKSSPPTVCTFGAGLWPGF